MIKNIPILKSILFLLLILGYNLSFAQGQKINQLLKQLHHPADKYVMVAAHRGDWRNAPENSLQAYQNAIAMGVDIIEVDLNITKDGVVVIMHDGTINRTTNGTGQPSDYTLKELKKFRLRNGLGILTDHTIPTFKEVMLLAKGKVLVNLDKSYPYYTQALQVLKETNTLNQAIFKADVKYDDLKQKYGLLADSITYMPVVNLQNPGAKGVIKTYQDSMHPVAFELIFSSDTSAILKDNKFIRQKGQSVWINSLWASLNGGHYDDIAVEQHNTKDSWHWLIAHGANILQTDRPKEMLQYLRSKKLHN